MGFYGNSLATAPQAFRRIQVHNADSNVDSAITAHQLEDTLILSGSTSIQLITNPTNNRIQFVLSPLNGEGKPIVTKHTQKLTTEYGSYILQDKTLATTGEGLISYMTDINIPIATEDAPGLMSASDKANLKTLLSAIEGKSYEISFYNTITNEIKIVTVKENFTINVNEVPELPSDTETVRVIGWKNTNADEPSTYDDPISLVNGVGAVRQNIFFVLHTIPKDDDSPSDTTTAHIYFVNTDGTLTIRTGIVNDTMATISIPDIIDDPDYNIYGWTQDGKTAIREDQWATIIIDEVMNFNVLKAQKESASLIANIRLGASQYATIRDATAFLDGATKDKFGVVKVTNTIIDPSDLGEGGSLLPEDTEGPVVPDIVLATRLASKDQSGWLSKQDKEALDNIHFLQGRSTLNFCTYLGSKMPGFNDNVENMSWIRINNIVFCSAKLTVRKSSAPTNPDFDNHECGLTGFPFKFANQGIINVYIETFNERPAVTNKVAKINQLVGQSQVTNDNTYALFKMTINDVGQYVIFDNANADLAENYNHIPASDLDIQFSAMYIAEPL